MSQLEEIEAIKRLKYKYIRCIDSKLWKELRELLVAGNVRDSGIPVRKASLG